MKHFKVGILGATGTVGQRFVTLLKDHPWFEITVLAASKSSAGKTYEEAVKKRWALSKGIPEDVKNIVLKDAIEDFKEISQNVDFVFCAIGLAKNDTIELEERYAKCECPVVSNNSANRMIADVPMILPEINPDHAKIIDYQKKRLGTKRGFIAVKPNCSLQCYVPAIFPLLPLGLKSVNVCTCQAISGAGKTFKDFPEILDNLIPYIPGEEEKSQLEPLKIFGRIENGKIVNEDNLKISARCFRVPISDGHTAAVFASFKNKIEESIILEKWKNYKNPIKSLDLPSAPSKFLTYFKEEDRPQIKLDRDLQKGMGISLGRLKADDLGNVKFVSMSHNTIRGAAGGAILLAELLCKMGYI